MAGQKWLEGDRNFYARLRVPVLLICGCRDRLVSLEEEEETLLVSHFGHSLLFSDIIFFCFTFVFFKIFSFFLLCKSKATLPLYLIMEYILSLFIQEAYTLLS